MPRLKPFTCLRPMAAKIFKDVSSMKLMFVIFWSHNVLRKVVRETDRNAGGPNNGIHATRIHLTKGGPGWFPIEIQEFKAFLGIHILMGLKRNSSVRSYWGKDFIIIIPLCQVQ